MAGAIPDILIEVAQDLATGVLPAGLLVVHDAVRCCHDEHAELPGGEHVADPLLHICDRNIKTGADDAALVEAAVEVNNDLATAMIVNDLELANVA